MRCFPSILTSSRACELKQTYDDVDFPPVIPVIRGRIAIPRLVSENLESGQPKGRFLAPS